MEGHIKANTATYVRRESSLKTENKKTDKALVGERYLDVQVGQVGHSIT